VTIAQTKRILIATYLEEALLAVEEEIALTVLLEEEIAMAVREAFLHVMDVIVWIIVIGIGSLLLLHATLEIIVTEKETLERGIIAVEVEEEGVEETRVVALLVAFTIVESHHEESFVISVTEIAMVEDDGHK
jgi:hypothetical protein